jgi:hypothetical protein
MKELKFCECCGKFISDINNNDYYSHISKKYCSACSDKVKKQKNLEQVKAYRKRKKQKDKFRDEQLELLQEENELLRKKIIQLREDVYCNG